MKLRTFAQSPNNRRCRTSNVEKRSSLHSDELCCNSLRYQRSPNSSIAQGIPCCRMCGRFPCMRTSHTFRGCLSACNSHSLWYHPTPCSKLHILRRYKLLLPFPSIPMFHNCYLCQQHRNTLLVWYSP